MSDGCRENVIEWLTNQKECGVTLSQRKWITKLKKYAEEHKDIKILAENNDGSVYAKVPLKWIKFSPPRSGREMTDEEKKRAAERLRLARESKEKEDAD